MANIKIIFIFTKLSKISGIRPDFFLLSGKSGIQPDSKNHLSSVSLQFLWTLIRNLISKIYES